jgi:hypothetical protein
MSQEIFRPFGVRHTDDLHPDCILTWGLILDAVLDMRKQEKRGKLSAILTAGPVTMRCLSTDASVVEGYANRGELFNKFYGIYIERIEVDLLLTTDHGTVCRALVHLVDFEEGGEFIDLDKEAVDVRIIEYYAA